MQNNQLGAAIVAAILSAGCSSETAELDKARTVTSDGDVAPLAREHRSVAELAASVLADDLGIPLTDVEVNSVRAVEWPNSSIGCPRPDEAYLDVITPGHKITLRVNNDIHVVHAAGDRAFVCRQKKVVPVPSTRLAAPWLEISTIARADLSQRIGVPENQITITGAERTTFTDAGLGCPEEGVDYSSAYVEGFVLRMRHGSRNFTYHTDLDRVVPCPAISND